MEILIIIVGVIWGILGIILFFKIWKATDDIAEIKRVITERASTQAPRQSVLNNPVKTTTPINKERKQSPSPSVHTSAEFRKRIGDLKTKLNSIEGSEEKFNKLNGFLNSEYKSLKSVILPENKSQLAQTWGLILMEVEPLYKSINKTIPWAFEQYK